MTPNSHLPAFTVLEALRCATARLQRRAAAAHCSGGTRRRAAPALLLRRAVAACGGGVLVLPPQPESPFIAEHRDLDGTYTFATVNAQWRF